MEALLDSGFVDIDYVDPSNGRTGLHKACAADHEYVCVGYQLWTVYDVIIFSYMCYVHVCVYMCIQLSVTMCMCVYMSI